MRFSLGRSVPRRRILDLLVPRKLEAQSEGHPKSLGRSRANCTALESRIREKVLRNRDGHGPTNLVAIRRLDAGILRMANDKLWFRVRLLKAVHMHEYRIELIRKAAELSKEIGMR